MFKKFIIGLILFIGNFITYSQNEYCGADFFVSPNHKMVIIVDKVQGEGGCCGYNSRLYKLPIDCNDFIQLDFYDQIVWDQSSTRIFTTNVNYASTIYSQNFLNTSIAIHDTTLKLIDEIKFASSPLHVFGKEMFFCREYDSINKSFVPMLYRYDFNSKKETFVYKFDTAYTFWPEQVDLFVYPMIKFRQTSIANGIIGILYKQDNLNDCYTFVVSVSILGSKLSFWKQGNYYDDSDLPDDGMIK